MTTGNGAFDQTPGQTTDASADEAPPPRLAPDEWEARCLARMRELDADADLALLRPIVRDMAASATWQTRTPEDAADWCFGPLRDGAKPPSAA